MNTSPKINIYNTDYFSMPGLVEPKSIALIVADPPYGTMGRHYVWDRKINFDHMMKRFDYELAPLGQIAIICSDRLQFEIVPAFAPKFEFRYRQTIVKTSATAFHKDRPRPNCEALLVFHRIGTRKRDRVFNYSDVGVLGKPYKRKNKAGSRSAMGGPKRPIDENKSGRRYPASVVFASNRPGMFDEEKHMNTHPSQKSLDLIRDTVLLLSNPGGLILDPFLGSGTTLVAAYQTGRSSIGFEIEEQFFKEATDRLSREIERSTVKNDV